MTIVQDLRFALRMFAKNPGFSLVAVLALGLGIGVNTTVFTLVNAVLFRGLPFAEPDRVMYLSCHNREQGRERMRVSLPDFRDWRAQARSFQDLAAFTGFGVNLSDEGHVPERYSGNRMSANAFPLIGQRTLIGRDFTAADTNPDAPAVAILGYGIWKSRYGADPKVLGRVVRINEKPATIIGVMPEGMKFPVNADLWTPLVATAALEKREARDLSVFGRLAPGIRMGQARAEMEAIAKSLAISYPDTNKGVGATVKPYNDEFNGGPIRVVFLALLAAVGFVLLIACANVANLLLSRAAGRAREVAVRAALGAGRARILRQLLTESLLLAVAGGLLGVALAAWGVRLFDLAVANVGKPYWIQFTLEPNVFGYFAGVLLATTLFSGLAPALHTLRHDVIETLKEGGRGSSGGAAARRMSGALVVVEVALSVILLTGAGLMIRSFLNLYLPSTGFPGGRVLTMRLNLAGDKYDQPDARVRFYESLLARLEAIPGVQSVALASNLPMGGSLGWRVEIEGQPPLEKDSRPDTDGLIVSPNYFPAMRIGILRGRALRPGDGLPGQEAAVINQRFASKHWGSDDPIGKRVRIVRDPAPGQPDQPAPWITIVGVGQEDRRQPQQDEVSPLLYVPYRQDPSRWMAAVAHTHVDAASLGMAFRRATTAVDENLPLSDVRPIEEYFARMRWPFRVFGTMFSLFAGIAVALSAVGIYAVMAYAVSLRTQEIGVRMAMGAGEWTVLGLVMRRSAWQLGIGLVLGLAGAFGLTRALKTLLIGISPTDPVTFGGAAAVLITAGLLACWRPARAAMRVDPVVALRHE